MTASQVRDAFLVSLDHIEAIQVKLGALIGKGRPLTFPDHYKLAEGLLLSAWSHWEELLRDLLVYDLATIPTGVLMSEVRRFRTKGAPARLAELIADHPDERKFVEWSDFDAVADRADSLIGSTNRFRLVIAALPGGQPLLNKSDLLIVKRIRNAVAHKSDYAWASFRLLARKVPFGLTSRQMKGITVGRFLVAHNWGGQRVLERAIAILRADARLLVP